MSLESGGGKKRTALAFVTVPLHIHAKNTCVNNKWPLATAPADSTRLSVTAPLLCLRNDSFTLLMAFLKRRKQVCAPCTLVLENFPPCVGAKGPFSHHCLPNETLGPLPPRPHPCRQHKRIDRHAPRVQIDLAL